MKSFKRVFLAVCVLCLILIPLGTANAATPDDQNFTVTNMDDLKSLVMKLNKETSETKIKEQRDYIYKNTDPKVLQEYFLDSMAEFEEKANDLISKVDQDNDLTSRMFSSNVYSNNDTWHKVVSTPASDGGKIVVELTDEPEGDVGTIFPSSVITPLDASGGTTLIKNYGQRRYTIHMYFQQLLADPSIVLRMHYTISNKGLILESTDHSGTTAYFPATIVSHTKRTDKYAEKNGYNINGQGDYNLTFDGYNGIGLAHYNLTIYGTVKLNYLYSSSASVKQSYSATGSKWLKDEPF